MLLQPELSVAPPRNDPRVVGLIAGRSCAAAVKARLLGATDDELTTLRGVVTTDAIVVLGEPSALPWVDGVTYLRVSEGEPSVLLPTFARTSIPESVWARAISLAHPDVVRPIVADISTHTLISAGNARPIVRKILEAWAAPQ